MWQRARSEVRRVARRSRSAAEGAYADTTRTWREQGAFGRHVATTWQWVGSENALLTTPPVTVAPCAFMVIVIPSLPP